MPYCPEQRAAPDRHFPDYLKLVRASSPVLWNISPCAQVEDALRKRELIKLRVLDNSMYSSREAAEEIAEKTGADVVQVIGSRFVLFKRNPKEPVIDIKLK